MGPGHPRPGQASCPGLHLATDVTWLQVSMLEGWRGRSWLPEGSSLASPGPAAMSLARGLPHPAAPGRPGPTAPHGGCSAKSFSAAREGTVPDPRRPHPPAGPLSEAHRLRPFLVCSRPPRSESAVHGLERHSRGRKSRGGLQGVLLAVVGPGLFLWTLLSSWLGRPGQRHPLPGSVLATADLGRPFCPSGGPVRGQVIGA